MSIENWKRPKLDKKLEKGEFVYKLLISYNGQKFFGWQSQHSKVFSNIYEAISFDNSIQGIIQAALKVITRQDITIIGSGRTDSGVHSNGQCASFTSFLDLDVLLLKKSLNALLPSTIRILEINKLNKFFNARYSTYLRQYIYKIKNFQDATAFDKGLVWFIRCEPELELLNKFAYLLEGEDRDFSCFDFTKRQDKDKNFSSRRDLLFARFYKRDKTVFFKIVANAFLYHQVRAIVGECINLVEDRKQTKEEKLEYFESLFKDKSKKVKFIAPSCGLYLDKIIYSKASYLRILADFKKRHYITD